MNAICPTVTAYTPDEYKRQIELVTSLSQRIHIDCMDGSFAPTVSPPIKDLWWPKTVRADLHIMYKEPMQCIDEVVNKHPNLTIVHHEAVHASSFIHELHEHRMKVGVALLSTTSVDVLSHYLSVIDHVLIFSGNLGHHGGSADLSLLHKVQWLRARRPDLEIGWDGGINADNVVKLFEAGVRVFNVGGYIHHADSPQDAYEKLKELLQ